MAEVPNQHPEELPLALVRLKRLKSDLATVHSEIGIIMSFQRYLKVEFQLTEEIADRVCAEMKKGGAFISAEDADMVSPEVVESYRLAVFQEVMPLYKVMHTSEEFENWLPHAFGLIVPLSGRHQPDACLRTNGKDDHSCEIGTCPIRVIASEITNAATAADYASYEYELDNEKACRQMHTLIAEATKFGFISESTKRLLESNYERTYTIAFPLTQ